MEAITKQYRDWLIPSSIFSGIGASVILYVLTRPALNELLIAAVMSATVSIVGFVIAVFWSFTRLEDIEVNEYRAVPSGVLFFCVTGGVLAMLTSLSLVCLERSLPMGLATVGVVVGGIVFFLSETYYRDKGRRFDRDAGQRTGEST